MLLLGINHTLEEGSLREESLINVLGNGTTLKLESPANPLWGVKHRNIAQLALEGSIHSYVQYGVGITYANNCLQHYWYMMTSIPI